MNNDYLDAIAFVFYWTMGLVGILFSFIDGGSPLSLVLGIVFIYWAIYGTLRTLTIRRMVKKALEAETDA